MLRGDRVGLRARAEADVSVLESQLGADVATRSRSDSRPWRPTPAGSPASIYAVPAPSDDAAIFSVVSLDPDGELVGDALLWGIDLHNRSAHLGLSLLPDHRGRGLGRDIVGVLCRYGFDTRGLHRLQIETLSDNVAMLRAAESAGFSREGLLRSAAWVSGTFVDEVVLGLLATD